MPGGTDLETRVQSCYNDKISLKAIFNTTTADMLQDLAGTNCFSPGYIIPHFLTATSHLMNKSVVNAWGSFTQPVSLYTMNAAYTSSNKSGALSPVSNALLDVEEALGISINNSTLNNGMIYSQFY